MRQIYSIFTINRIGVIKSWNWNKNVHSFICREVQRLYVLHSEWSKKRTIHLCLHYHTHGGKKQRCYCVIGRHKSWGCEPANPGPHHNGCYVWQRNFPETCLVLYLWFVVEGRLSIYLANKLITLQGRTNIYLCADFNRNLWRRYLPAIWNRFTRANTKAE